VTWFEVTGNDAARLRAFYADVFGWRAADVARGASYGVMDAIAHGIGGGIGTTPMPTTQRDRRVPRTGPARRWLAGLAFR
jgi:predicted enzyme related to lactoylglutathione lyase